MTDDGSCVLLIFLQEIIGAGEGDLVDVAVNLFSGHADASVTDGQCARFFVDADAHGQVAQFTFKLTFHGERFQFLGGIHCVADDFAKEDFVVTVEEFLDDGENVFGCNSDITFLIHLFGVLKVS